MCSPLKINFRNTNLVLKIRYLALILDTSAFALSGTVVFCRVGVND